MIINERDDERLDSFLDSFFNFLKENSQYKIYKNESVHDPSKFIEKIDGTILPAETEGPFVLDNEFQPFIIESLYKLMKIMLDGIDDKLFGFAERPLHEFIVTWVFLFTHSSVKKSHQDRLRTLLFTGHFKFFSADSSDLIIYLDKREKYLRTNDLLKLEKDISANDYFDYVWEVAKGIKHNYGNSLFESYFKIIKFDEIWKHLSMRVHANPLAINEVVNNTDVRVRHKLMLAYCARQVLDYFASNDRRSVEKLIYSYDKFIKNHRIMPS